MNALLQTALAPGALKGRSALVFGGSSGIGLASARTLASLGADLVLVARHAGRLQQSAEMLRGESPVKVIAEARDITDLEAVQTLLERYRGVDILVTNCGGPPVKPFSQLELSEWEAAWQSQLRSAVQACQILVPGMAQRGWGRVIMIASITVAHPLRGFALSNAIRPGLAGLAATLSQEYAAQGVTANAVCPGITRTGRIEALMQQAIKQGKTREMVEADWTASIPARRMGEPEEIAAMVGFLASDAAAFVTGQTLVVDGGESRGG